LSASINNDNNDVVGSQKPIMSAKLKLDVCARKPTKCVCIQFYIETMEATIDRMQLFESLVVPRLCKIFMVFRPWYESNMNLTCQDYAAG
jgi:hypothetical protein